MLCQQPPPGCVSAMRCDRVDSSFGLMPTSNEAVRAQTVSGLLFLHAGRGVGHTSAPDGVDRTRLLCISIATQVCVEVILFCTKLHPCLCAN